MMISWEDLISAIKNQSILQYNESTNEVDVLSKTFSNIQLNKQLLDNLIEENEKENVWKVIQEKKSDNENAVKFVWLKYLSVAAILLFMLGIFRLVEYNKSANKLLPRYATIINNAKTKREVQLPDGSKIWLHYNSSVQYDSNQFNIHKRELVFKGKAFFDIAKNSEKPFIISTTAFSVKVVGTSFEVDVSDSSNCMVKVHSGIVKVNNNNMDEKLFAGNALSYNLLSQKLRLSKVNADEAEALRLNQIIFNNDNVYSIANKLNSWYGLKIKVKDQYPINKVAFTGSIQDDGLENVLKGLSYLAGFKYKIDTNEIIIYPQH